MTRSSRPRHPSPRPAGRPARTRPRGRVWTFLLSLLLTIAGHGAAGPAGAAPAALTAPPDGTVGAAPAAGSADGATAFSDLPAAAQGLITATLGRGDPAYQAQATPGGWRLEHTGQALSATFDSAGAHIRSGTQAWNLSATAWGRGAPREALAAAPATAAANRIAYERGAVTEWYVNGPGGLEQGLTLAEPPAGPAGEPVRLALSTSGTLSPVKNAAGDGLTLHGADGQAELHYRGLSAYDADGRTLPAWVEVAGATVVLAVNDAGARYPVVVDPYIQQAKLTAADGAANDYLGSSIAVSADGATIVAGARGATIGSNSSQGAAYVFVRPAGGWATGTSTAKLTASDGAANASLSYSLALSADGSTIVAGASGATIGSKVSQGAVYVFGKPNGGWTDSTETAKLTAADGTANARLGFSVAVSTDGSTIVAGADQADVGNNHIQGAAYVFVKPSGGWTTGISTAKLTASDGKAYYYQGWSVALSGDGATIVMGEGGHNSPQDAAYVFVKPTGGWATGTETAKLTGSDALDSDLFGSSLAVSSDGGTIVAGARYAGISDSYHQGAVYVFVKPTGTWVNRTQTAKLTASDGAASSYFGSSVGCSSDGSTVVTGALGTGAPANSGAAYVFAVPSSNATLSNLTTSAATLTPAFASATTSYSATVANSVTGLTVTPTAAAGATIQARVNAGTWSNVTSASTSATLPLNTASNTVEVKVTAQDGTTTKTYSVAVARKAAQATLSVTGPHAVTYGSTGIATSSGGSGSGNVTYSAGTSIGCSVSVSTVSVTNASESCVLTATKAADGTYDTATSAPYTVTLNKATPTASITNSPVTYSGAVQTAAVACLGGGTATLASGGTGTNAGSYPATVNCAASTNYTAATGLAAGSFVINQASQTISFANPGNQALGTSPTLRASATSGLTVSFGTATPGVCTSTSGGTLTFTGAGTCTVNADQGGNLNYQAAAQVPQTFAVIAPPTLATPTTANLGANQVTLNLQSSATGTGWFTLLPDTATPCGTGTQVKNGQDATGNPAPYRGSLALTAATLAHYTVRNLTQSSAYTACFTADGGTTPPARLTVMRYTGTWQLVGSRGASAGALAGPSLAFAPDGTPAVAYQDQADGGRATVLHLDGADWSPIGAAGLTPGSAAATALAFGPDGQPVLAYQDGTQGGRATVQRFDGTTWAVLGSPGVTSGTAGAPALAYAPNGDPYLAYDDGATSPPNQVTVLRYTGSGWVEVGGAGLSGAAAGAPALALAPDGTVLTAYPDGGTTPPDRATVRRLVSGTWGEVGTAGLSAAAAADLALALAPDGAPTLAYRDGATTPPNRASVQRFDAGAWADLGGAGLSAGTTAATALAYGPDGTPYVAYQDGANANRATLMRLVERTGITVGTNPAGLALSVDGNGYTSTQTFAWAPGSRHTLTVTSPQTGSGSRAVFSSWSDGGAMSHTITAPAIPTTFTAAFATQYQLTTAVNPPSLGYVLPPSGNWYPVGSQVAVSVTPSTGALFTTWTGAVANPTSPTTTVTMNAAQTVTANLGGAPALRAQVTGKSGTADNRVWTLSLTNSGSGTATGVQLTALGLTVANGGSCSPTLKTTLPVAVADIAAGASQGAALTIDFSGCAASAKFNLQPTYTFGPGTRSGTNSATSLLR